MLNLNPSEIGLVNKLEFNDVSFKHRTAQYKALDNINFIANKGETIAFVGPSGAGKSTLVKLLVGLYRPQEGNILYNDLNGNDIDFDDLRNQIGFCYTRHTIVCWHYKRKFIICKS